MFNFTEISDISLNQQLENYFLDRIIAREIKAGSEIPSVREFARLHHINVHTVNQVYEKLVDMGIFQKKAAESYICLSLSEEKRNELATRRNYERNSAVTLIDTFSNQLKSVFDQQKLKNILLQVIKSINPGSRVFFAFSHQNSQVMTLKKGETEIPLDVGDPIFEQIRKSKSVLLVKELIAIHPRGQLWEFMTEHKITLVFPLHENFRLFGFIAIRQGQINDTLHNELEILSVLINQFCVAYLTASYYFDSLEKRRLEDELIMARNIQSQLLPKALPCSEHFTVAAYFKPYYAVGGDFYDFIEIDSQRVAIIIGDASGKGLPAAMMISQVQAIFKAKLSGFASLTQLIGEINQQFVAFTPSGSFITLFIGIYDKATRQLEYVNAGHNYPFRISSEGSLTALKQGGAALGIITNYQYQSESLVLANGDLIFCYTDGITEMMDRRECEYGETRLQQFALQYHDLDPHQIIENLIQDLNYFSGDESLQDDCTVLILKI